MSDEDPYYGSYQELLRKIHVWLKSDAADASSEYLVTRGQANVLARALRDALTLPNVAAALEKSRWRDADAMTEIRSGKGKDRFRRAAIARGLISGKDTNRTYPPEFVLAQLFVTLTTESDQIDLLDPIARQTGLDELVWTIDECPVSPSRAVRILAKLHGALSPKACLRELQRQRKKINRQKNKSAGSDPETDELPDLSHLPSAKSLDGDSED